MFFFFWERGGGGRSGFVGPLKHIVGMQGVDCLSGPLTQGSRVQRHTEIVLQS